MLQHSYHTHLFQRHKCTCMLKEIHLIKDNELFTNTPSYRESTPPSRSRVGHII